MERRQVECPFPGICAHSVPKLRGGESSGLGCRVRENGLKPLITCSMAELPPMRVALREKEVSEYLDRHIRVWADQAKQGEGVFAVYYRDAYQTVRKDLLGKELDLGDVDDR